MKPIVSIIMGSTSDLPVMEKAAKLLDEMHAVSYTHLDVYKRQPQSVSCAKAAK